MTETLNSVRVSIEQRRGCGYRQEGGLYLVGPALSAPCGALPVELEVCPTCGTGIKPSRGWTWVKPWPLLREAAMDCFASGVGNCATGPSRCTVAVMAYPNNEDTRAGLLWVGAEHYPYPSHFLLEARDLGVSRRIPQLPRDFEVGKTWVLLAHRRAVNVAHIRDAGRTEAPGIFAAFKPTAIERVVSEAEAADSAAMQKLRDRGIDPVSVRYA
jgi:hypothetical protein